MKGKLDICFDIFDVGKFQCYLNNPSKELIFQICDFFSTISVASTKTHIVTKTKNSPKQILDGTKFDINSYDNFDDLNFDLS